MIKLELCTKEYESCNVCFSSGDCIKLILGTYNSTTSIRLCQKCLNELKIKLIKSEEE